MNQRAQVLAVALGVAAIFTATNATAEVQVSWEVSPGEGQAGDGHTHVVLVLRGDVALRVDLGLIDGDCIDNRSSPIAGPSLTCEYPEMSTTLSVTQRGRNLVLRQQISGGGVSDPLDESRTVAIFPLPRAPRRRGR